MADKPTKELKWNKHIQLIQVLNPKEDGKKGKQEQMTNGTNRKQMEKWQIKPILPNDHIKDNSLNASIKSKISYIPSTRNPH